VSTRRCLDPTTTELFGGGALDLEVETARRKKSRAGSATNASTVEELRCARGSNPSRHKNNREQKGEETTRSGAVRHANSMQVVVATLASG
jgi:hypothetical protein